MIHRVRNDSRPGISLLEVLTAIFIMGVGLLALLTLFPLGALSMARAVRDDRAAAAGANAAALANAYDLRNDPNAVALLGHLPPGYSATAFPLNPDPNGPGYPVLVDPAYQTLPGGTTLGAVAGVTPGITRITPSYIASVPEKARCFSFMDEIQFDKVGQAIPGGVSVRRPGTYTWTYLLRRPRSSLPALTEMSVIVYANRATDAVSGEAVFNGTVGAPLGTAGTTAVSITFAGDRPNIRKGGWILDSTYRTVPVNGTNYGTVNGLFYRVASVNDTGATTLTLELETPLRENVVTLVVMENVITVLDRGTSWQP